MEAEVSLSALAKLDPVIAKLEVARSALAEASSLQQVKEIADVAAAAEIYARRQELGEEAIGYAHTVKIEALARLGELLKDLPKAEGTRGQLAGPGPGRGKTGSTRVEPPVSDVPKYADLRLNKKTAMVAQHLAGLPMDVRGAIARRETTLTEARRQERHRTRGAISLPEGKYRVIYADPPWKYRDTRVGLGGNDQRVDRAETAAEQDYPTMSKAELIERVPVHSFSHADAVLFCWATFPILPDALEVVSSWGFTYKTAFVWHKPRGSFGHYHKADAELLLVTTRGSCTPDVDVRESQILHAPAEGHSRKPDAARQLIDRLYPHGPRIELFSRRPPQGSWKAWGNEP